MRFKGGIHPKYNKSTAASSVEKMPLLGRYVVPISQHIGAPGEVIVKKGQEVGRGEPLTKAGGFVSAPVFAPTSGKVKAIKEFPHMMGNMQMAIEIIADGEDTCWEGVKPLGLWREQTPEDLKSAIAAAGLVGMGGATFPTHVKLSPPADKPIDTFILNGAECEPYLTSDHRVMVEQATEVMEGVGLMMRVLGVTKGYVGVEANKKDALEALRNACPKDLDIEFALLEVKYPQGSEKHLIYALTGKTVPAGGLPMEVGCLVQNVGTAVAALEAVEKGWSLIERVTTVTGSGINEPKNISARVGTPLQDVIAFCGGLTSAASKVIFGGPMMGFSQFSLDVSLIKGTSGILCLDADEVTQFTAGPCIRCGACVDVCPMGLVPSALGQYAERDRYAELGELCVNDCIECGSCAYVCPSHRPLVQLFKRGKAELRKLQQQAG
ncbi:MAG: electron transport complex subunit RsxC [bacterium]|nr:electron transport complex subunit RsxC [bacterium]